MSHLDRLQRAFARSHIRLRYEDGVYHVHNDAANASILLPASLLLEEKAVKQLLAFASVRSPDGQAVVCNACATPDFHPGAIAPVGSIVATEGDAVIPAAIGTDINCGMRLLSTGLSLASVAVHRTRLLNGLKAVLLENRRDVPVSTSAFKALFDAGPAAFAEAVKPEGLWAQVHRDRLVHEIDRSIGLGEFRAHSRHAPDAFVRGRETFRDPCLGTPGSGNHFVELQVVDALFDRHAAYETGLKVGDVVVMIHSGSRDLGFHVGARWMDRARDAWPRGVRHPESKLYALTGPLADEYLEAMGVAARYAWLNRVVLAELARGVLAEVCGLDHSRLVVDVPHNVVLHEGGMNIHRKGATPAREGDIALIPGSMGDHSYVVRGLGHPRWLRSCSHGAGRRLRRQEVRARASGAPRETGWECITLREERRIEEAPEAYKPIGPVIESQEEAGLISPIARLRPWVTFKA
ncbi:RtcB family protein [Eleftheria terrae]|uniref:RtcB family protein n=1 Tax=Eleftheria terrae TaxID=1597781 RepID=UPI00263A8C38|nr:RtcB family protein [Eleftheria terrae]WKB55769.1 RtcB family protein [Eleftheria terrae]